MIQTHRILVGVFLLVILSYMSPRARGDALSAGVESAPFPIAGRFEASPILPPNFFFDISGPSFSAMAEFGLDGPASITGPSGLAECLLLAFGHPEARRGADSHPEIVCWQVGGSVGTTCTSLDPCCAGRPKSYAWSSSRTTI
jgi:hypothetical protein